ncbi:mannonate dehydratase [Cyclobacterium qasimii]|uniref:Mannonate dehydratase n=2 Tax=Cyclobacterium qasimii TaxID=1350429 RepID=S7VBK4_9BACT|nr:mannonate dehydratase [Cyclobacterium qasimii]EPR66952.1 Mannonate dehydratase [Cyclobacterium qasimii M12-11B]GEO20205.1 mannonate dehydratase [Cyclobacterium qasimii]
MSLIQSWRWFGPNDSVSLQDILQAGATDVVSALHYIPHGEVWPLEDILERKALIEAAGLKWSIVESVPVHEAIKTRGNANEKYLDNYKTTLRNLSKAGLNLVCYNFMPVLDWTRTDLSYRLQNGAKALYFDWADLASFDHYILQREKAFSYYSDEVVELAKLRWADMTEERKKELSDIILMGVPTEKSMTKEDLINSIAIYREIGKAGLRDNLVYFLKSIQQTCEEEGITMTIHPDDPPFPILGLPRIASNVEDLKYIMDKVPEFFNGVCFCTGSLGAGGHNDLPEILAKIGERVHFAHLRNVKKNNRGDFYEAEHLNGDVDMVTIMQQLIKLNKNRKRPILYRPDHGHQLLDDLDKQTNPGYSAIGRLKGLAELRGLEIGLDR